MKTGVVYPQIELPTTADVVRRVVLRVEELGFDYLLATDHVVGADISNRDPPMPQGYTDRDSFHDPFTLLSFTAALTRLELATGVLILPQRQTALVAKQAADLDWLCNQRLRLGVGSGWNHVEYAVLGKSFKDRGKRMDEQIAFLRKLWIEPILTWKGEFEEIERANINIRPKAPIPIWTGGMAEPAFRRAGHVADGFIFIGTDEVGKAGWERVRGHLKEAGRAERDFGRELMVYGQAADPDTVADMIKRWRDFGGTHACFDTLRHGFGDVEAHLDYVAAVRKRL